MAGVAEGLPLRRPLAMPIITKRNMPCLTITKRNMPCLTITKRNKTQTKTN
jgi:hypothetical protein